MKKEYLKIVLLLILLIIMVYLWYRNFNNQHQASNPAHIIEESEVMQTKIQRVSKIKQALGPLPDQNQGIHPDLNADLKFNIKRDPFVSNVQLQQYLAQKYRPKKKSSPKSAKNSSSQSSKKSPAVISRFSLTGIIIDSHNSKAIINNEIYDQGDVIDDFRIVQITQQGVKLSSGQLDFFINAPGFEELPGIIYEEEKE